MIEWFNNDELGIFFSHIPCVAVRYIINSMSKAERKSVTKYPFINKCDLQVELRDYKKNKKYCFVIHKGYCWDGATIPRLFWRIIGAKTDNKFLIPSLIHDVLCENKDFVERDRHFADKVFECLLEVSEVPKVKRNIMFMAVDTFQKFCGW